MEFSRKEYWSVLPFPSPGDLPDPGIEPGSSALQAYSLSSKPSGKPRTDIVNLKNVFLYTAFSIQFFYTQFLNINVLLYTVTNRWGNNGNSERL